MEIALFGGTFNPPTKAHHNIVQNCSRLEFIDEVWIMPSGQRDDKQFETSNEHRIDMLEQMIGDIVTEKTIHIETLEMNMNQATHTARTVDLLHRAFSMHHFWFVFGVDSYYDMPNWQDGQYLQDNLDMLIVPRDERVVEATDRVRWLPLSKDSFTSSTEIRRRIACGESFEGLTPPAVSDYIIEHGLYQDRISA